MTTDTEPFLSTGVAQACPWSGPGRAESLTIRATW